MKKQNKGATTNFLLIFRNVCVLNNATKEKTYYVLNEYKEVTESEACKCQKN